MEARSKKKPVPRYEGQIPDDLVRYLSKHWDGFAGLPIEQQMHLCHMIKTVGSHYRTHSHDENYSFWEAAELDEVYGRYKFPELNERLGVFEVLKDEQGRDKYSPRKGFTKAYKLSDRMAATLDKYLGSPSRYRRVILRNLSGDIASVPHSPMVSKRKATAGKDGKQVTRQSRVGFTVPVVAAVVSVDRARLLKIVRECERLLLAMELGKYQPSVLHPNPDEKRLRGFIREAKQILKASHNLNKGMEDAIGHRYEQSASGRLYAKNLNFQTTNRDIRKAALYGCYDYDIENCHYSILSQMAAQYGYQCAAINGYLDKKGPVRRLLADQLGITIEQAKECLIALIYGAKFSVRMNEYMEPQDALAKIVGTDIAGRLFEHQIFRALKDDIAGAREAVLDGHKPNRQGGLVNMMGLSIRVAGSNTRQQLAHLLQGVEVKALEAMLEDVYRQSGGQQWVQVIQHDGFTSRHKLNEQQLEAAIQAATGYRLAVSTDGMLAPDVHGAVAERVRPAPVFEAVYQLKKPANPHQH